MNHALASLYIFAQDYGTLPNAQFSGAELADAARSFVLPIIVVVVLIMAVVAFFSRQMATLIPVLLGGLIIIGFLAAPNLFVTIGGALADLVPGA